MKSKYSNLNKKMGKIRKENGRIETGQGIITMS
jgi:hypothetical protein